MRQEHLDQTEKTRESTKKVERRFLGEAMNSKKGAMEMIEELEKI